MRPHRCKYWLNPNITDKDEFRENVKEVCDLYHGAPELDKQGIKTVSLDECCGIQALERTNPTKPIQAGIPERIESEYIRHGTLSLIANFDVVSGKILSSTIGETRNEEDFLEHIKALIAKYPQVKEWRFVADQLNIHKSESLVRCIAKKLKNKDDLGVKGKSGVLKSMDSRADFLKDPSHSIRFLYTPKHCSWMNQIEIWFGILSRKVIKRGNFISKEDLKEKLHSFIEYFNKTMAKPYKWTFNGIPLKA